MSDIEEAIQAPPAPPAEDPRPRPKRRAAAAVIDRRQPANKTVGWMLGTADGPRPGWPAPPR